MRSGQYNCVSLSQPPLLIRSYRLSTVWEVCGAIYCHKEANQSPRNDTSCTSKSENIRKTHRSGAESLMGDGRRLD